MAVGVLSQAEKKITVVKPDQNYVQFFHSKRSKVVILSENSCQILTAYTDFYTRIEFRSHNGATFFQIFIYLRFIKLQVI